MIKATIKKIEHKEGILNNRSYMYYEIVSVTDDGKSYTIKLFEKDLRDIFPHKLDWVKIGVLVEVREDMDGYYLRKL